MTKKLKIFALLVFVFGAVTSCTEDEEVPPSTSGTATVNFDFTPYIDGAELELGERFVNVHGYPVEVTDLTFYLSNIKLHNGAETTVLSDVELVNIRNQDSGFGFEVAAANFDAVSFDLGVAQELNGTANPDFLVSIYAPDHPLSESNGMYWIWQTGYRFFKFEGRYDTLPNTDLVLPLTYAIHSGRDTLFREIPPFSRSIQAVGGTSVNLHFAVDVDRIFLNANDSLDLKTEGSFHGSLAQMDVGIKFANNSAAAFRLLP